MLPNNQALERGSDAGPALACYHSDGCRLTSRRRFRYEKLHGKGASGFPPNAHKGKRFPLNCAEALGHENRDLSASFRAFESIVDRTHASNRQPYVIRTKRGAVTSAWNKSHDVEELMLGAVPGEPALGRGPAPSGDYSRHEYHHPAAGWGAARSVAHILERAAEPVEGLRALFVMNHENGGFDCPGCAWPDDPSGLKLDICENGVKHVTWELAPAKADREFFAAHTVSELAEWNDYDLETVGRLAEPLSYNPASDKYEPISWEDAFALVGDTLRALGSPHQAAFYTSGRLSNEATFLYQLWVREFGTNNLPDCSNMCHEASGRAMAAAIGTGKGTVDLNDWEQADAIWLLGDNAATNAPRMLTWLAEADRRGVQLIHINPLIEAASRRTIVPHEFVNMATFHTTEVGTMSVQVRIGGDMALMRGVAKAVLEAAAKDPGALDEEFIEYYTHGFDKYRALVESTSWSELVRAPALPSPRSGSLRTTISRRSG